MIEAYFDESGTHKSAPILCVGGYLFEREQAIKFDAAWRTMLKESGDIPFFHMAACEAAEFPFDHTPSEIREAMIGRAVREIKAHMTYGVVLAVNENQFKSIIPKHPLIGSAYSWLVNQVGAAVRKWEQDHDYRGQITYFFESGAPHQDEANYIMNLQASNEADNEKSCYAGHGFYHKNDTAGLQAADLLVWHYYNDFERQQAGGYSRDRYATLIDDRYWHFMWTEDFLRDEAKKICELARLYPLAGT